MGHSSPKLIASQRLTVSLQPPTIRAQLSSSPVLSFIHSLSLSPICSSVVSSPSLTQPSSSFSLSLSSATHVLLAPRRTRHVLATYIVPPNNVCPKGREITDFVARRATNIATIVGPIESVNCWIRYRWKIATSMISSRNRLVCFSSRLDCGLCQSDGSSMSEKATLLRQPIVSRRVKAPRGL